MPAIPSTIIALIDSDIDPRHRALKHRLWLNNSEKLGAGSYDDDLNGFVDDLRGWNFVADNNDVSDDLGHGTQVAGIITSQLRNQPSISILPLKALNDTGSGTVADVVEAMDYAIVRRAAVINCSFGSPAFSPAMLEAIKRAETAGIVVIAAAGNRGKSLSESPFYPASYRSHQASNLISVAATNRDNLIAGFSNYPADIAAPGENIRTAHRGNSYVRLTGTSASAGFVAATAGLLKSTRGFVSAQTIRDTILKSVRELFDLKDKVASKGSVNKVAALSLFTRNDRNITTSSKTRNRSPRAPRATMQSGSNLDTMRANSPQPPDAYQQTGALPPATYTDPAPANTANFNSYLTQMSTPGQATGVAGSLPFQPADPTARTVSVGGWSYNLESRNYNFSAPVLALPGRAGLGISFGLSYNSRIWAKDPVTGSMVFNADRGFPAPGWRIGFGAIQIKSQATPAYSNSITGKQSLIYIAPDGARHDLAFNASTGYYESYDSSYLRFEPVNRVLQMPNGLRLYFQIDSFSNNSNQYLPNYAIDRNGNFINIYYQTLSNGAVVIQYLIDTAGRRIDFNYQNNRLTSISQNRNGVTFYYLRLDYQPITIQTQFYQLTPDPVNINGTQVYFISRITYPTGVNYRFVYTSYGLINTIQKWVPSITGQGGERMIASSIFYVAHCVDPNAPPGHPNYCQPLSDVGSFSQRDDWAENWQGGATQAYSYYYGQPVGDLIFNPSDPTGRRFSVKKEGSQITTAFYAGETKTKWDVVTYQSDSGLPYTSNPRIQEIQNWALNNDSTFTAKRTAFSYIQRDGMWLVENKDEYAGLAALHRRTNTTYTSFPSQYILGLPQQISVHDGSFVLISRVTNSYDETGTFVDSNNQIASYFIDATTDGVIQQDNTNYGFNFTARRNPTSVTQFKVESGAVTGSRILKRVSYDTNGNVRVETDAAGNRKQVVYTDYYSNKPAGVGQTHVQVYTAQDPIGFRSGSQWDYYTGLTVKTFTLVPGSSIETQVVTTSYDFADRPLQTIRPDGGWVKTGYWDNWLATVTSQLIETGKVRYKFEECDGAGRARRKASDHPDGVAGKYSGQVFVFDKVGQVEDSSNVIAINGSWTPSYEDASTGFLFTHLTRDELARLKVVTFPDGNTKQYSYDGCGCAGNSETRITDELGHYTITKTDALGRLVEAIEPSSSTYNNIYSKATYVYDALDRLVRIDHADTTGVQIQSRYFSYDGYGRLSQENTPEAGIITYSFTANDQVQTKTDARGITTTFGYNTRNLTTSISYSDGTPGVTFGYDEFGARQTMSDGEGTTSYSYNSLRQLQSESRTFTGLVGNTYTLNYTYNLADQLKSVNYLVTTGANPGDPLTLGHIGKTFARLTPSAAR